MMSTMKNIPVGAILILLAALLAVAVLVKARPRRPPHTQQFFEIIPSGAPQRDLRVAGQGVESVAQQLQGSWFGNSLGGGGRVQIVRHWDGSQLRVLVSCSKGAVQAEQLASSVGGRAVPLDQPLHLGKMNDVALLRQVQWVGGKQASNNLPMPLEGLATALGSLMLGQKTESALVVTLWPPGRFWFNRYRRWLAGGESAQNALMAFNDPQLQSNALLAASMGACTGPGGQADAMVLSAVTHLPYNAFDSQTTAPSDLAGGVAGIALVALAGVATWFKWGGANIPAAIVVALLALGVPLTLRIIGGPIAPRRLLSQLRVGVMPADKSVGAYWRRWLRTKQGIGMVQPPVPWVMLAPSQVAALLALPELGGQGAQARLATARVAPAPLLLPGGPMMGVDSQDRPVYMDPSVLEQGVLCTGDPGQGKTVFQLGLWGSLVALRQAQREQDDQDRGFMIWIETKGEGAQRAVDMAVRAGLPRDQILYLGIEQTTGPRLELADREDTQRGASEITEAMAYSLPKDWIMGRSAAALNAGWHLALSMTRTMTDTLQGRMPPTPVVVRGLLGGDSDPAAQSHWYEWFRDWVAYYKQHGPSHDDTIPKLQSLCDAYERISTYMRLDRKTRDETMRPSTDRLTDLLYAPNLWIVRADRPTWTLRDVLRERRVVVINFGGGHVSPQVAQRMGAMMLYVLSAAVQEVCQGWQSQGYSVSIFSDEVSHICGTGSDRDVIGTLKDAGRAWGVRQFYATQRLDQIPLSVQSALRTCDTMLFLRTNNRVMADMAIQDLGGSGDPDDRGFTQNDIVNLAKFQGIMRTRAADLAQPPFTLRLVPEDQLDPTVVVGRPQPHPALGL